jgi:hypothetical protein
MEPREQLPDEHADLSKFLERVYASAYWSFEVGARMEDVVYQIERAFECVHDLDEEEGRACRMIKDLAQM